MIPSIITLWAFISCLGKKNRHGLPKAQLIQPWFAFIIPGKPETAADLILVKFMN